MEGSLRATVPPRPLREATRISAHQSRAVTIPITSRGGRGGLGSRLSSLRIEEKESPSTLDSHGSAIEESLRATVPPRPLREVTRISAHQSRALTIAYYLTRGTRRIGLTSQLSRN